MNCFLRRGHGKNLLSMSASDRSANGNSTLPSDMNKRLEPPERFVVVMRDMHTRAWNVDFFDNPASATKLARVASCSDSLHIC